MRLLTIDILCVLLLAVTAPASAEQQQAEVIKATTTAEKASGRLPLLEPKDMTPGQLQSYERDPVNRTNLFRLLGHANTLSPPIAAFGLAMATTITVPSMEREIITLAVLHMERGKYEWAQHMEVVKFMGIPQGKVDAIAKDRFGDSVFTDRERALLAFTRQVVKTVRVDDDTFNAVAAFYDPRQIVETVMVISNYMMLVRVTEVDELPIDGVAAADFWKRQKR